MIIVYFVFAVKRQATSNEGHVGGQVELKTNWFLKVHGSDGTGHRHLGRAGYFTAVTTAKTTNLDIYSENYKWNINQLFVIITRVYCGILNRYNNMYINEINKYQFISINSLIKS